MTKVTDLHVALVALVTAALPSATRISNGYQLELASDLFLKNGFAITFGPAANPRQDITPILRMERDFAIKLTKRIAATENNAEAQGDIAEAVFEDQLTLIKAVEADSTLNGVVADVYFTGDNGIETLTPQDATGSAYFVLTSIFNCRYIESLT
jgi:hypothetical protein